MINSLSKDSHITHQMRFSSQGSEKSEYKREYKRTAPAKNVNNSDIIMKKPTEISFGGFFRGKNAVEPARIYTSNLVKKFLYNADENQVLFSAGFALILTCLFRPAAIMVIPEKEKNKDDKKYAAAHSIASGVIGYAISAIITKPIANAIGKIIQEPTKYFKKGAKYLMEDKKAMDAASTYLNRMPDLIMAPFKAIITIALIPPILKHVFGWEKKSGKESKVSTPMINDYSTLNFNSKTPHAKKAFQNFMGGSK